MAYALAPRLLRAVKNSGLSFTEVAGWQSRGRGTMRSIMTITLHHTATPRSFKRSTDAPTLNVVKNGRAGLPGPLSQILLGRSGHVYLVAAGVSNHAGRSRATSMTNPHAIGIEAEGALEAWPAGQYRAYVLLVAALLTEFGLANGRALRHAETCSPPGRKIDASFDGPTFRRAVANVKPGTNTPAPPKKKGLFGMALKASDSRTEKRSIARGKESILRTRSKNTNSFLASVKTNETVLVDAHLRVSGLREGQVAEAWLRLGEYSKTEGKSYSRYNYPRVTIHGRAGGGDVHVSVPLVDTVRMSPKHKGDMRLYLVVKNVSGDECVVESVKFHILGD